MQQPGWGNDGSHNVSGRAEERGVEGRWSSVVVAATAVRCFPVEVDEVDVLRRVILESMPVPRFEAFANGPVSWALEPPPSVPQSLQRTANALLVTYSALATHSTTTLHD